MSNSCLIYCTVYWICKYNLGIKCKVNCKYVTITLEGDNIADVEVKIV
jgi:hypothetical protein